MVTSSFVRFKMAGLFLVYLFIINCVLVEAVGRDCEQKNTEGNSTSDTQIDVKCETVLQKAPTQIQQTKTQINTKQNSITLQINPNLPKKSYEKFIFYPRTTTTKSTLHQESKPQSNTVSSKVIMPTTSSTLAVTLKMERTTILSNIPLIIPEPKTTQIQQTINQIETQLNSIIIDTDPTISRQNTGDLNAPSPSHLPPLLVSKEYQPDPKISTTIPDTTSIIFPGTTSTTMPDTTSTTMSDITSTTLPDTTSTAMSDTTSTTLADTTSTAMPDTTSTAMSDTTSTTLADTTSTAMPDTTSATMSDTTSTTMPDNTSTTMPDTTSTTLLDTTSRVVLELGPTSTLQQEPTAQPTVIMPTTLSLTTASTRVIPSTPKAELTSTISQKDALNKTATKSPMPDNKSNTVASKPINPSILTNTIDKGDRTLADKLPGVMTYDTSSTNIPVAAIIGGVGGVLLLGLTAVLLFIFIRKCPRNKIIEEAVTTYSSVDSTTKIIIPRPSYTRHLDTNSTYYQEISAVSSRENLVQMNSWRGSV